MKKSGFGSAACIFKEKKILLLHRIEDDDEWELPGGGIDFGESPEEAAIREAKEEVCLNVKSKGLLTVDSNMKTSEKHHIWFYYLCEILEGQEHIGDEAHSECKWFTVEDLKKIPNLSIQVKNIIPELENIVKWIK